MWESKRENAPKANPWILVSSTHFVTFIPNFWIIYHKAAINIPERERQKHLREKKKSDGLGISKYFALNVTVNLKLLLKNTAIPIVSHIHNFAENIEDISHDLMLGKESLDM